MRWLLLFLAVAFFATLIAVVGVRVTREGDAFVLGLVCGAGASIPASLLAFYLVQRGASSPQDDHTRAQAYPPLIIVNGPPPVAKQPPPDFPVLSEREATPPPGRRYRVIGEE